MWDIVDELLYALSEPYPFDTRAVRQSSAKPADGPAGASPPLSEEALRRARAAGVPLERAVRSRVVAPHEGIDVGPPIAFRFDDPQLQALLERAKGTAFDKR